MTQSINLAGVVRDQANVIFLISTDPKELLLEALSDSVFGVITLAASIYGMVK